MPTDENVEIRPVRNGRGLVARIPFNPGEEIVLVRGKIVTVDEVWALWDTSPERAANCISFDEEFYIDPHNEICQFANHSCEPNSGMVRELGQLVLKACKSIAPGEEITFDYATLSTADDEWTMACNCGHVSCRGIVGNVSTIPEETIARYVRLGIVPDFVLNTR